MNKVIKWLLPLGMFSSAIYIFHVLLGQALWPEYNPITTDISSLTADNAPNATLLRIIGSFYSVSFLVFTLVMVYFAFKNYSRLTRVGFILFAVMAITVVIGYGLFPLDGNKTVMSFQNTMHIVVTVLVVFSSIASMFCLAFGYLKRERLKLLGRITLATAIIFTVFGIMNPISMGAKLDILGLTERLVIFTLMAFTFFISLIYTFNLRVFLTKGKDAKQKE